VTEAISLTIDLTESKKQLDYIKISGDILLVIINDIGYANKKQRKS
jgi:hypothetical protein